MKAYRIPQTDLVVSRIAYGCGNLAGWERTPITGKDVEHAVKVIEAAVDNGITLFDHADLYGFGKGEQLFGEVLKRAPDLRQRIVIQSKCGQRFPDDWLPGNPIHIDLSYLHILGAVEGSLKRLGTERLDILLLHVADALLQPQEVARALDDLHRSGKVRYFGVSNFNGAQIELLKKHVRQPLVVNQIRMGLGYSYPIADGLEFAVQLAKGEDAEEGFTALAGGGVLDYCRSHDIQVQAWSPLRGTFLKPIEEVESKSQPLAQLLRDLAKKKEVSPSAIAVAWLLRHPAGIVPIIGSSQPEHIAQNCEAEQVVLTSEEWYALLALTIDLKRRSI